MDRGSTIKEEIKGILLLLAGLTILISLLSHHQWDQSFFTHSAQLKNLLGRVGSNLSDILMQSVGYAAYIFPFVFIFAGLRKVMRHTVIHTRLVFVTAFIFLLLASSALLELTSCSHTNGVHKGGIIGFQISKITLMTVSSTGSYLLFITLFLVSLMYLVPFSLVSLISRIRGKISLGARALSAIKSRKGRVTAELPVRKAEDVVVPVFEQELLPLGEPEIAIQPQEKRIIRPAASRKKATGEFELPGIELLKDSPPSKSRPSKEELLERSDLLEKKLLDYMIEGKVTYVSPGPVVTMFEFEPAPGIKINKIIALADDLAMALKASSVRIFPIHGRSTLGIEVPNRDREDVFLKDVIAHDAFNKNPCRLTIALGKDIFGTPVMADLSRMPHLLIAGATGSGKSVGLNSIILSLLYRATPREVKMLMIDPKMLELSAYEDIPHLLMPVITLPKEASNALKKLVVEMERRYRVLAGSGARNIETYNKKIESLQTKPSESTPDDAKEVLPYIVIIIDELADLMFASGREVEDSIARLAQMARAAGIHLILATQRPSVDVITGIIKANFPSRISFQVSSKLDSRIILDTYGAEQLLGKGDMLFTSPGKKIKRIHGAYVSEEEIRDVVSFIKSQAGPDYTLFEDLAVPEEGKPSFAEQDELYAEARDIVLAAGQASISYIQRRMKIGYNRAARIMEMLEEEGLVGPPGEAGKPREVIRRRM